MRPENPFALAAYTLQGRARAFVPNVGVEADAQHLPDFEGIRQHQQLALGIDCGSNRRAGQPRVSNLAHVRASTAMRAVARGPRPMLDPKETSGTEHRIIVQSEDRKWHSRPSVLPGQGGLNVACGFGRTLRYRTPSVERWVCRGSRYQPIHMTHLQWFQANVIAFQYNVFCFHNGSQSRFCAASSKQRSTDVIELLDLCGDCRLEMRL